MAGAPQSVVRIDEYCRRKGLLRLDALGFGVHGSVFTAENQTTRYRSAVKAIERERFYLEQGVHAVPAVIIDDRHLIQGAQPVEAFERALRQIVAN